VIYQSCISDVPLGKACRKLALQAHSATVFPMEHVYQSASMLPSLCTTYWIGSNAARTLSCWARDEVADEPHCVRATSESRSGS
jgi:hypothetical protein